MLDDLVLVEESPLPRPNDAKMIDLGREMGEEFLLYRDARRMLEDEIWPACDRGLMCIRDDLRQAIPTMHLIDNGMLGESDLREAEKLIRNKLLNGLVPTDESYLRAASLNEDDDEETLRRYQEYLIYLCEQAKLRSALEVALDQLCTRGTTALGVRWDRIKAVRKIPEPLQEQMEAAAEELALTDEKGARIDRQRIKKIKYWQPIYSGPKVYPIDMYRLWFDPTVDLFECADIPFIYVFFKSLGDLKRAKSDEGEPLYYEEVLRDVREWSYEEFYAEFPKAIESTKIMGVDPTVRNHARFVPVFLFHRLIRETDDGDVYVDKFFYVAKGTQAGEWRIIRVHDNPSDFGDKPFYVAHYDRWLNVPYGTGAIEKSLSAWKAKCLIAALGLNLKVLAGLPPYSYISGILKQDGKPKMGPLAANEIVNRTGVGLDWIKFFPINPNNVLLSMQEERQYADKIVSQTGSTSAGTLSNPTKRLARNPTATEIRQETYEAAESTQTLINRLASDLVQPSIQSVANLARQHYTEDQRYIVRNPSGEVGVGQITADEIDRERELVVVGRRGLANRAHEIDSLLKALELLANPQAAQVIQSLPIILQDILFRLLPLLSVPLKPEYRIPPEQLAARDPAAMMSALQMGLQTPQMRQMIAQQLMDSEEGAEMVAGLVELGQELQASIEQAKRGDVA